MNNDYNKKSDEIAPNLSLFKFKVNSRVKFHEVDSVGVVHNVQYFYWLEWARTEYLKQIGISLNPLTFIKEFPLMVVHHELDYFTPARFNEEYEVLSRVVFLKNSSLGFENIICFPDRRLIAKASAVFVYLDRKTLQPVRIPDNIRNLLKEFEKEDIIFID